MSLTVGKLKLMLERLLRVKAGQQALLLVPPPEASSSSGGGGASSAQVGEGALQRHCSVNHGPCLAFTALNTYSLPWLLP